MSAKIRFAVEDLSGDVMHIDEVNKDHMQSFRCRSCGYEMTAVKSTARRKDWHFRHVVMRDCCGAPDRALHDYAVQVLLAETSLMIAENRQIAYAHACKECPFADYRSDVRVVHQGEHVHLEIVVTHDLGHEKIKQYRGQKIKCIRIDLTDAVLRTADPAIIRQAIVGSHTNKTIIYWDASEAVPASESLIQRLGVIVVVIAAISMLIKYLITRRQKTKRRYVAYKIHRHYKCRQSKYSGNLTPKEYLRLLPISSN